MLNYPRGEFSRCPEDRGKIRVERDFTSVEHAYRKISLARDRGELNPGVKLYVYRTPNKSYNQAECSNIV